ncbi:armadillo-like helical domain-containing protein 3 [Galendromus occidentalis]|uniref:Armadillo-like helical domain-containing protein 3 n=1 Tax=Galendromus occidentalis TaxID=34638 RepID=A0AAJ6QRC3_9ACAR|nr:armadillo-like helical domain-containing protein 3 [Galendromus occidentalis]
MASKGNRFPLKKKFVQIYEGLLDGEEPWSSNDHFWDELFLLKVNSGFLTKEFELMKPEKLLQLKPVINRISAESIRAVKSDNRIRIVNAYETFATLVRALFSKNRELDLGIDVIDLLLGTDVAEASMEDLLGVSCTFLEIPFPHGFHQTVLDTLLVLVTAAETVSNNVLVEFLMTTSVFEALIGLLSDGISRQKCGYHAVLLLTLIVNYRKYESTNPYIMKLSIADNELALNGFGQVIACTLYDYNRRFAAPGARETVTRNSVPGGMFSGLTSWMGIFTPLSSPEESSPIEGENKRCDAALLAMYEAVHLNRNFFAVLTNTQPGSIELRPASPPLTPSTPDAPSSGSHVRSDNQSFESHNADLHEAPTNLFVTFIEFVSIVMQNTKEESSFHTTKLCFINLTCIAEDQYANSIMHDINMQYKVVIHHAPMRHRKLPSTRDCPSRPLAAAVLDLMVEFMLCNMRKNFSLDLYVRCLGIVHRLLCYQKRYRVRLLYPWKELWSALISVLKFILANEVTLAKRYNVFIVCSQIVNIINLFITYGDTFLASPPSYDELYYEIIRCNQVFDNLYSTALRYASGDSEKTTQWRESAARLASHLVNIRAIVNHFNPKINSWATANGLASLTEAQVLEVVRGNYDSLTLKLHDNLDQFERYSEKPRETPFFAAMVKSILEHVRKQSEDERHQHSQTTTIPELSGVR